MAAIIESTRSDVSRLPVPDLVQAMEKLASAVKPFCEDTHLYTEFTNLVEKFVSGSGVKLHQLLVNKSKQTINWLSHDWFIPSIYLYNLNPIMIWTNPSLVFPRYEPKCHSRDEVANFISRTICGLLDFREQLQHGNFPDMYPCKEQYTKIFGTTRIPGLNMDEIKVGDLSLEAKSIVVSRNNMFYEIKLPESRELLPIVLRDAISKILAERNPGVSLPIGTLTSLPRNEWAKIWPRLEDDAKNAIIGSQFVVCLDHISGHNLAKFENDHLTALSQHVLHADLGNAGNRWYDKGVQLVFALSASGDAVMGSGVNYEHSSSEAVTVARLMEHVTRYVSSLADSCSETAQVDLGGDFLKLLSFGAQEELQKDIDIATEKYIALANSLDMKVFKFSEYGKDWIKSLRQSPDSFIQVAINWTYFRLQGQIGSCYETGGMRNFQQGRTDIIRSATNEMAAFCHSPSLESLLLAIKAHNQLARSVVSGQGFDRLMLGFQCALEEVENGRWKWGQDGDTVITDEDGLTLRKLIDHELYRRIRHFDLKTSQVYTNSSDSFCSYGPYVKDGCVCCYNPTSDGITFAVSAFIDVEKRLDVRKFSKELHETLLDMRHMFVKQ